MRAALLAVAVAATAWYVLGIRQAVDTNRSAAIISAHAPLSASQARHASSLVNGAGFLNPDRQVDVLRAQLDRDQGNLRGARTILQRVVAGEPQNVLAWQGLALSSVGDIKEFTLAADRIRQLVPVVPPPP